MTQVLFDDFTQANGTAWNAAKWTVTKGGVAATAADVQTNQGRMFTSANSTGNYVRALGVHTAGLTQEVLVKVVKSGLNQVRVNILTSGGFRTTAGQQSIPMNGFHFQSFGTDTFGTLFYLPNGGATQLATNIPFATGTNWLRMRFDNTTKRLQVRTWVDGNAEPATWAYDAVQASFPTTAGVVALSVQATATASTYNTYFDNVTVDDLAVVPVAVTVMETPATASAMALEPSVTASKAKTVTTTPGLATAALSEPMVSTVKNKTFAASPATASALAPTPVVKATTVYNTDFEDYALGTPVGWTRRLGTTFTIEESAAALSGKWFYGPATSANSVHTFDAMSPSVDGDVLVRTYGSGGVVYNYVSNSNYRVIGFDSTTSLFATGSSGTTQSVPASLSTTFNWLRVRVSAGRVQARAWKNGDVEPSTWDLDFAHNLTPGLWGHYAYTNKASAMDYFSLNTNTGEVAASYSRGKEIDAVALTATAVIVEPAVTAGSAKEVSVAALVASAAIVEPVVTAQDTITFSAGAATANAEMRDGSAVSPDVTSFPSPASANAAMPEAVAYAGHDEAVDVSVAEASAEMTEPEFSNQTNINIAAEPMQAAARLPYYTEADDPWIQTIARALPPLGVNDAYGSLPIWMRFGQETFGPLKNYARTSAPEYGSWSGVPEFGVRDDYNRKATHFDGDSYALTSLASGTRPAPLTWEIVFRTTDADGPLISSEVASDTTTYYRELFTGLELKGGRLATISRVLQANSSGLISTYQDQSYTVPGAPVNDGQWHHVMVTFGSRGVEVFVDGVSRFIRRPAFGGGSVMAVQPAERIGTNSSATDFFVGDVVSFVQYPYQLPREAGNRHYYDYVVATVISAGLTTASAEMPGGKGRGNKLRALGLYVNGGEVHTYGLGDPNWSGFRVWSPTQQNLRAFSDEPFEHGPYTVFPRRLNETRDEYDYSLGLGNLDDIEDLADYDMFFFIDHWKPNEVRDDRELTGSFVNLQPAYEEFVRSIRRAIDTGIAFWCPQPQLAADLGFIDALDVHSFMEQEYDAKSWLEDDPVWKARLNARKIDYRDTHFLNKYRVTAQLDGFTDLEGRIVDEVVYWQNPDAYNLRPEYHKWNAKELEGGLQPGDEVYMPVPLALNSGSTPVRDYFRDKIWSVPAGKHAGVAVAKEQVTVNMNDNRDVPNPYADNALTIVIQPGDSVAGRPIGGKVLVDFMSGYQVGAEFVQTLGERNYVLVQLPPYGTPDYPNMDLFDGFDFDGRRMNSYFELKDSQITVEVSGTGGTKNVTKQIETPFFDETHKYPLMAYRQYPWLERGLTWLGVKDEIGEGGVRVLAARSEASAAMPSAGVTVQKHNSVHAGSPAQALASIIKPAGIVEPDVTVTTLPMTAAARMLALATVVAPSPMTAYAEMGDARSRGTGQDYVLSIKSFTNATVYLKEDAV